MSQIEPAETNGHSKIDSLLPEQFKIQSIDRLNILDEAERLRDELNQSINQIRRQPFSQSNDDLLAQYSHSLEHINQKIAEIRRNNQYIALLAVSFIFLIVCILMAFEQKLPNVWFVEWINQSHRQRIDDLGIDQSMLPEQEFEWKFW